LAKTVYEDVCESDIYAWAISETQAGNKQLNQKIKEIPLNKVAVVWPKRCMTDVFNDSCIVIYSFRFSQSLDDLHHDEDAGYYF
jgi:hypothetical protein